MSRLIDADALIAQIEKNQCEPCKIRGHDRKGLRCRFCQYGDEMDDIYDAPSASEWIPCSERLPVARRSVVLSTKDWTGEGCYWETTEYHVIWKGYRWSATFWDDEVIAWMPLPEPYREGEINETD